MIADCPACYGCGIYQSNGETCQQCKGWGNLLVEVKGPCDTAGEVQTEDIETVYKRRRENLTFEDWDRQQAEQYRARRLTTALELAGWAAEDATWD